MDDRHAVFDAKHTTTFCNFFLCMRQHRGPAIDACGNSADRIPVNKKRKAIEKAIKMTLPQMLPDSLRFRILHHDSKSCCGLQVADYFNWAIYRPQFKARTDVRQRLKQHRSSSCHVRSDLFGIALENYNAV